ncbi:hypothetical protein RUND412_001378 [Rhizina undulata]
MLGTPCFHHQSAEFSNNAMEHAQITANMAGPPEKSQHTIEGERSASAIVDKALFSREATANSSKKANKRGRGKASKARYRESRKEKRENRHESSPPFAASEEATEHSPKHFTKSLSEDYRQFIQQQARIAVATLENDFAPENAGHSDSKEKLVGQFLELAAILNDMENGGTVPQFPEAQEVSEPTCTIAANKISESPLLNRVASTTKSSAVSAYGVQRGGELSILFQSMDLEDNVDPSKIFGTPTANAYEEENVENVYDSFLEPTRTEPFNLKYARRVARAAVDPARVKEALQFIRNCISEPSSNEPFNRKTRRVSRPEVDTDKVRKALPSIIKQLDRLAEEHKARCVRNQADQEKNRLRLKALFEQVYELEVLLESVSRHGSVADHDSAANDDSAAGGEPSFCVECYDSSGIFWSSGYFGSL